MRDYSRRRVLATFLFLPVFTIYGSAVAADSASLVQEKRTALKGFDPVSYFLDGHPEKGLTEFSADYDDAKFLFSSAEHKTLFEADPDKYAPQYGGFCAITMAHGASVEPDPEAWVISDGKLYVFRDKGGVALFQQQNAAIMDKASKVWSELDRKP